MPYRLRFDGVNDVVRVPTAGAFIADATYVFRWKGIINAFPASGLTGIIGTVTGSNSNGVVMHASEGSGGCRFYAAGVSVYGSGAGFIQVGVDNEYALEHDSGTGAYRWKRNGTVISSGTYTGSGSVQKLDQFGRSSGTSTSYLSADIEEFYVNAGGLETTWQADLSGGTGSVLPSIGGTNNGTLVNFPTNDSQWIFYSTGTSWSGVIGKTTLTLTSKSVLISLGYRQNIGKSSQTLTTDLLNVQAGHSQVINNNNITLDFKQLSVQAGTSISFTGLLEKSNYPITYKTLAAKLGWAGANNKQSLVLNTKPETISAGFEVETSKSTFIVGDKQLSVTAGSSISFVGLLNKTNYPVDSKSFDVQSGFVSEINNQNIPIQFQQLGIESGVGLNITIGKSSLTLAGKTLDIINGHILSAQKEVLSLVGKQLSIGEIEYPIVPVERIFSIEHKNTTYILKQTINIFVMKGK